MDLGVVFDDPGSDPLRAGRPSLYLFWHENMLFPATTYARHGVATLVSRHRDGEIIAQVMRMLRGQAIRGSTTHGAVPALRHMMRRARAQHLGITPDGPRGPRRVVQMGAIYIASRTGMPLVPLGFAYRSCWRAGSWDRMVVPRPFTVGRCVAGRPICLPDGLDRAQMEDARRQVQQTMDQVQARADALAASGARVPNFLSLHQATQRE